MVMEALARHAYRAYGLSIHSDIQCPELAPHPDPAQIPDVNIRVLAHGSCEFNALENGRYQVQPGRFRLDVPGVARYCVQEGKRILVETCADTSADRVRLFLLGSTMGALLYQRGLFPLHGSAVETPRGAMIFVGAQGAGKSTLTAQFHAKGYRLLSDDVCAIAQTPSGLRIVPAVSQFRLCSDAYERLGKKAGARFDVDKYVVPMGEGYCPEPAPLRMIHILSSDDVECPRFEILCGLSRLQYLLQNLYRPCYLPGQQTQSQLVRMAGVIAGQWDLAIIRRHRDSTVTKDLVTFLESAWEDRFRTTSLRGKPVMRRFGPKRNISVAINCSPQS